MNKQLTQAIQKLSDDFNAMEWKYENNEHRIQIWPGKPDEDIMICVYKGNEFLENFHRQNFFFFNFAYQGDYSAFSYISNHKIIIKEGECYIGQPYAGYAINDKSEDEKIIIGVLIQKEAFFQTFFNVLSKDKQLFEFFLQPQMDAFSQEYIRLHFENIPYIKQLLELMIIEYAHIKEDTQDVLKPLTLALLMQVARNYKKIAMQESSHSITDTFIQYIEENFSNCTLQSMADHFHYHPNYISNLLSKETGKTFSQILLEQRMNRALSLLNGTDLSIEQIASFLGYANQSNFYKAFKVYYHMTPREYIKKSGY